MMHTRDHETIMAWVERRDGHAARVVGLRDDAVSDTQPDTGSLRIGFPGYASEEALEPMSWEDFFAAFEDAGLTFYYQETDANGQPSSVYRIE